jgi:CHAT domain-containing protein
MRIESEEPWIPWELCKLQGVENGRIVEGPFLAEAFAVTRWIPGIALHADLPMRKMAVIVPDDSGLPFAESEKQYMLSLASGGRQVESIPATYLDVHAALAAGEHNAWHFSGHGVFRDPNPNRSGMLLENEEELSPEDISGVVRNLGQADPLVFLNACQIGRSAMSLTDVGGWAPQFLKAGAAAFVGAYWSVFDEPAQNFAKTFYDKLLGGATIGDAAHQARAAIRPAGDPTWLAYTVFADPAAKVV